MRTPPPVHRHGEETGTSEESAPKQKHSKFDCLVGRPAPPLKKGDRVALVSPAGFARADRVEVGRRLLEKWGLSVDIGRHATKRLGYLSSLDAERLEDLQAAIDDAQVKAILCTRGGYGTQRLLDAVALDRLCRRPKILVGFSDISALHLAVFIQCGLVTFYGPSLAWNDSQSTEGSQESLMKLITGQWQPPLYYIAHETEPLYELRLGDRAAEGILLGGNLSVIASSIGTKFGLERIEGPIILLLEDVREAPYRVDRMLTQLRRVGIFRAVKGVVLGQFPDCIGTRGEQTVRDVLEERLGDLNVPIVGGFQIGHGCGQLTIPLGVWARLDSIRGSLTILSTATRGFD